MISNERPSPYGRQPRYGQSLPPQPREKIPEDTLKTGMVEVERKKFAFALRENPRGRFLRITEDAKGKCSTIIIPSTGLEEFQRMIEEMAQTEKALPAPTPAPNPATDDSIGNR